jgi:predicted nucleic acid-binding protein
MNADQVSYVDSSAIVKLIVKEPESAALRSYVRGREPLVSSALARTEVNRAVLPLGAAALRRAGEVLKRIELVRVNNRVLNMAGRMEPVDLRSLDAIHLATAALLEGTLSDLITYDTRMASAAQVFGWIVTSPS